MVLMNYLQDSNGDADIGNRLMYTGRRKEGEGDINGERSMEAYRLQYTKQITNGNLVYDSANSN